jgi:hypothetical protein
LHLSAGHTKLARARQTSKDIFDELPPLTDIFTENEAYYSEKYEHLIMVHVVTDLVTLLSL